MEVDVVMKAKKREEKLDADFSKRLAQMEEEDSVSEELPVAKRIT